MIENKERFYLLFIEEQYKISFKNDDIYENIKLPSTVSLNGYRKVFEINYKNSFLLTFFIFILINILLCFSFYNFETEIVSINFLFLSFLSSSYIFSIFLSYHIINYLKLILFKFKNKEFLKKQFIYKNKFLKNVNFLKEIDLNYFNKEKIDTVHSNLNELNKYKLAEEAVKLIYERDILYSINILNEFLCCQLNTDARNEIAIRIREIRLNNEIDKNKIILENKELIEEKNLLV